MKGQYDVGYSLNEKTEMKLRFGPNTVIGGFEVLYNRRCHYIYKSFTKVESLFIKHSNFKLIEKKFPEYFESIRLKALSNYLSKIRNSLEI